MGASNSRARERRPRVPSTNRHQRAANLFDGYPAYMGQIPGFEAAMAHSNRQSNGGLYFGNSVLMPGTRIPPDSMDALILAQMRPDLLHMFPSIQQHLVHPPPPPPEVRNTNVLRIDINLRKDSLMLVQDELNPDIYAVEFSFDSAINGSIDIIYNASEETSKDGTQRFMPKSVPPPPPIPFSSELNQRFKQERDHAMNISQFKNEDLIFHPKKDVFPVIICLRSALKGDQDSSSLQVQTTFCTLVQHTPSNKWSIKVVKQKIQVGGQAYVLQEIYGIEQATGGANGPDDEGSECVICMSEPRDTTVLPCRHMCLCHDCAEVLRHKSNKCPICRDEVQSFIKIKVNNDNEGSPAK